MITKVKNRQLKEVNDIKATLKLEIDVTTDGKSTEDIRDISEAYMEEIIKKAEFVGSGYDFIHKDNTHRMISEHELARLLEDSYTLSLLYDADVENWGDYREALFNPEGDGKLPISEYDPQAAIEGYWRV